MNAAELIQTIEQTGADRQGILDVLCDGQALAAMGVDDESIVNDAYNLVRDAKSEWAVEDEDGEVIGIFYSREAADAAAHKPENLQSGGWPAIVGSQPARRLIGS